LFISASKLLLLLLLVGNGDVFIVSKLLAPWLLVLKLEIKLFILFPDVLLGFVRFNEAKWLKSKFVDGLNAALTFALVLALSKLLAVLFVPLFD
jgi:hypothetical protein